MGYPKYVGAQGRVYLFPIVLIGARRKVPTALADHVEKNNLQGKLKYSLFVGASSGAETENRWARLDMIGIQVDGYICTYCLI